MESIKEILEEYSAFDISISNQLNKMIQVKFHIKHGNEKPSHIIRNEINEEVEKLDFVHHITSGIKNGKKIEGYDKFHITIVVKMKYFNNKTDNSIIGKFIKLCIDNNINSARGIRDYFVSDVRDLANYTHTIKDRKEKINYRNLKEKFIHFCHVHGLIDDYKLQVQVHENFKNPHTLYWFRIGDYTFHLVRAIFYLDKDKLEYLPNLYERKSFQINNENFIENMELMRQFIGNSKLFRIMEMDYKFMF